MVLLPKLWTLNMISVKTLVGVSACTISAFAFANSADPSVPEHTLEETTITATRVEQSTFDAAASVSVFSRDDIDMQLPLNIGDMLDHETGIDILRTGSLGSVTSLQTRGSTSSQTLILINGQRFSSATLGQTNFQAIDPAQIERIEFVRGSRSALYGADALGGVIEITTRQGKTRDESYVSARVGSHNLAHMAVGTEASVGDLQYGIGISSLYTQGFDSTVDTTGFSDDDDSYRRYNFNVNMNYDVGDASALSASHFQSYSQNEFDSAFSAETSEPFAKSGSSVSTIQYLHAFTDDLESRISFAHTRDLNKQYDHQIENGARTSDFATSRNSLFWQNDWHTSNYQTLTFGLDMYSENIEASTDYSKDSRTNTAPFAQLKSEFGALDTVLGIRYDDNEAFGSETTHSVSVGLKMGSQHKIYTSFSEGFRAPTFNDQFWPEGQYSGGNPNIQPESSDNYELGLRGNYDWLNWEIVLFENQVQDLIDWAPDENFFYQPSNVADAKIRGAEFNTSANFGNLNIDFGSGYFSAEDEVTGLQLLDKSRQKSSLSASHKVADFRYGASVRYQGKRLISRDFETGEEQFLDSYSLMSFFAHWDATTQLTFSVTLNNIGDEEYQTNPKYNEDERNGSLSANLRF